LSPRRHIDSGKEKARPFLPSIDQLINELTSVVIASIADAQVTPKALYLLQQTVVRSQYVNFWETQTNIFVTRQRQSIDSPQVDWGLKTTRLVRDYGPGAPRAAGRREGQQFIEYLEQSDLNALANWVSRLDWLSFLGAIFVAHL
jgi:hypothetical protein